MTLDLAAQLNPAQLEAVQSLDGPQLVIAGAGTGKTRTLVYRVANLVHSGVAPESILLLTFTRRAAREMLRRASGILDERCQRVAGGTFHSFANLVLRRYAQQAGYADGFTILDSSDSADLIALLRADAGLNKRERRFPKKGTIQALFSRVINTGRPLEELLDEQYPQFLEELEALEALQRSYGERKKLQNVMDFDDLLVNLRDLLVRDAGVRQRLASSYRSILVDEYQDTNRLQAHIAALLASRHSNLMVVGDDAQSIYSFRGADFRNIMDFPQLFPQAKVTTLEQNYRSTQPVLDLGNAILASAREKFDKRLFTEVPGDVRPRLIHLEDDYAQAQYVCREILALREEGVPLTEMAVLARAAWHTNVLEVELGHRNIPFRKFGGLRFVEAAHVKDVCALLKLGVNPRDEAAWFRVLQLYEGVGPATAQRVSGAVLAAGGDLAPLADPALAGRRYGEDFKALKALLEHLARDGTTVPEKLALAIEAYRDLMPKKYDDVQRRLRDLESLDTMAAHYAQMDDFLTDLAIDPPEMGRREETAEDTEDEWLTLSTVHSAKGLEWDAVFVVNLTEGQFPHYRSMEDEAAYEEERRLLYVAVTRARRRLYLLHPQAVSRRGGYQDDFGAVSPLLADVEALGPLGDWVDEENFWDLEEGSEDDGGDGGGAGGDSGEVLSRIQSYFG
jgi:DNA helicase II / ATP-dependent DNA helicase PcrA